MICDAAPQFFHNIYLKLARASDNFWSHTQQWRLASINSWNKTIPDSCWQHWSENAMQVGHVIMDDDDEDPELEELDEADEDPWWPAVVVRNICINKVCCINANWSAVFKTLEVTIMSISGAPFMLVELPPPRQPTGILESLFSVE